MPGLSRLSATCVMSLDTSDGRTDGASWATDGHYMLHSLSGLNERRDDRCLLMLHVLPVGSLPNCFPPPPRSKTPFCICSMTHPLASRCIGISALPPFDGLYNNGRIHLGHNLSPHTLLTPVCLGETIRGNIVNEMSLAAETDSVPPVTRFGPQNICL